MSQYGLNDEQWRVVSYESADSKVPSILMTSASAGSGKTRCLVEKIHFLLDSGISARSIIACTFTNKAANEMKSRIKAFCPAVKDMQISTIHSMSVRIIKTFPQFTPLKVPFSIYDDGDQMSVIKTILKARKMENNPYEIMSLISKAKAEGCLIEDEKIEEIRQIYQNILVKNNAADFDDLLTYARDCLKNNTCKNHYSNLWQHILVDEFQDTSLIQFEIVTLLYDPLKTKTMFVVGDWNQSIYGWRLAHPENIDKFIKLFNPAVMALSYNYRSAPEIIVHANAHLQFGNPMVAKSNIKGSISMTAFKDQEEEANRIADAIYKIGDYENTAILYRVNTRSLLFEKSFAMKRIPYKVLGDIPFYRRRIVKDLLSYCKAATNPQDIESLTRIVNVPKRGFGESKQEKLLTEGRPYIESIANEMPEIKSLLDLLEEIKNQRPVQAINEVIQRTNYRALLTKDTDLFMLDYFLDIISGFNTIEELILTSNFLEEDTGHGVKLMTAHASKGLEFNNVFVVGVEKGVWPHQLSENIPEEERLYYVAVTRAKQRLNISCSKSRIYRGKPEFVAPSPLFYKSHKIIYNG